MIRKRGVRLSCPLRGQATSRPARGGINNPPRPRLPTSTASKLAGASGNSLWRFASGRRCRSQPRTRSAVASATTREQDYRPDAEELKLLLPKTAAQFVVGGLGQNHQCLAGQPGAPGRRAIVDCLVSLLNQPLDPAALPRPVTVHPSLAIDWPESAEIDLHRCRWSRRVMLGLTAYPSWIDWASPSNPVWAGVFAKS